MAAEGGEESMFAAESSVSVVDNGAEEVGTQEQGENETDTGGLKEEGAVVAEESGVGSMSEGGASTSVVDTGAEEGEAEEQEDKPEEEEEEGGKQDVGLSDGDESEHVHSTIMDDFQDTTSLGEGLDDRVEGGGCTGGDEAVVGVAKTINEIEQMEKREEEEEKSEMGEIELEEEMEEEAWMSIVDDADHVDGLYIAQEDWGEEEGQDVAKGQDERLSVVRQDGVGPGKEASTNSSTHSSNGWSRTDTSTAFEPTSMEAPDDRHEDMTQLAWTNDDAIRIKTMASTKSPQSTTNSPEASTNSPESMPERSPSPHATVCQGVEDEHKNEGHLEEAAASVATVGADQGQETDKGVDHQGQEETTDIPEHDSDIVDQTYLHTFGNLLGEKCVDQRLEHLPTTSGTQSSERGAVGQMGLGEPVGAYFNFKTPADGDPQGLVRRSPLRDLLEVDKVLPLRDETRQKVHMGKSADMQQTLIDAAPALRKEGAAAVAAKAELAGLLKEDTQNAELQVRTAAKEKGSLPLPVAKDTIPVHVEGAGLHHVPVLREGTVGTQVVGAGKWTKEEDTLLVHAIGMYPAGVKSRWDMISKKVGSRNSKQAKRHAAEPRFMRLLSSTFTITAPADSNAATRASTVRSGTGTCSTGAVAMSRQTPLSTHKDLPEYEEDIPEHGGGVDQAYVHTLVQEGKKYVDQGMDAQRARSRGDAEAGLMPLRQVHEGVHFGDPARAVWSHDLTDGGRVRGDDQERDDKKVKVDGESETLQELQEPQHTGVSLGSETKESHVKESYLEDTMHRITRLEQTLLEHTNEMDGTQPMHHIFSNGFNDTVLSPVDAPRFVSPPPSSPPLWDGYYQSDQAAAALAHAYTPTENDTPHGSAVTVAAAATEDVTKAAGFEDGDHVPVHGGQVDLTYVHTLVEERGDYVAWALGAGARYTSAEALRGLTQMPDAALRSTYGDPACAVWSSGTQLSGKTESVLASDRALDILQDRDMTAEMGGGGEEDCGSDSVYVSEFISDDYGSLQSKMQACTAESGVASDEYRPWARSDEYETFPDTCLSAENTDARVEGGDGEESEALPHILLQELSTDRQDSLQQPLQHLAATDMADGVSAPASCQLVGQVGSDMEERGGDRKSVV